LKIFYEMVTGTLPTSKVLAENYVGLPLD